MDRALADVLPLSRTRIQALIDEGKVTMEGAVVERAAEPVPEGAVVEITVPPRPEPSLEPAAIPLTFLYEDDACLVVDKPAGLVVHPAPGHPDRTLVNALLHHRPEVVGVGSERRPGLVHRLDKDTSGCLLVAKDARAHAALSSQFAERTVEKRYEAFTWGHLGDEEGTLDAPIGRSPSDRKRMATVARGGRRAVTGYTVVERYAVAERLDLRLETGRTHQIRVHLADVGHPVVGDRRYGGGPARARGFHGPQRAWAAEAAEAATRQALHARLLGFDRFPDGERVTVESPRPDDLEGLRDVLLRRRT